MIKLNAFARMVGISSVYASYLENGKRPAPSKKVLDSMIAVLQLNPDEVTILLMLAAKTHHGPALPPEIIEYINNNEYVSTALRFAMEHKAPSYIWIELIERISDIN